MSGAAAKTPRDVLAWMRVQGCPVTTAQIGAGMGWSQADVCDAITALILVCGTPLAPCGARDGVPLWECMEADHG